MSPHAQLIAMAELEGWVITSHGWHHSVTRRAPPEWPRPPRYESLDAIARVEALAPSQGWSHRYADELRQVLNDARRHEPHWIGPTPFDYITAKAAHRVKAILKATNRWVEDAPVEAST